MNNIEFIKQQITFEKTNGQFKESTKPIKPTKNSPSTTSTLSKIGSKKNIGIDSSEPSPCKPPQSISDIALELILLKNIDFNSKNKSQNKPPITQYYCKKTLYFISQMTCILIASCSLVSSELFFETPTFNVYLLASGLSIILLQVLQFGAQKIRAKNNEFSIQTTKNINNKLLVQAISILKNKLNIVNGFDIEYTLEPSIICETKTRCKTKNQYKRKKTNHILTIKIGIPLLHQLNNAEFYSLIVYKLSMYKISNTKPIQRFIHKTQVGLFQKNSNAQFFNAQFPNTQLKWHHLLFNSQNQIGSRKIFEFIQSEALDITLSIFSQKTFIEGLKIEDRLMQNYADYKKQAQKGNQLIPINAITQLVCIGAENLQDNHSSRFLSLKKAIIQRSDSITHNIHNDSHLNLYPAFFLIEDANEMAQNLSMAFFKHHGFPKAQLIKTHTHGHQPFKYDPLNQLIQHFTNGTFRINTPILPDTCIHKSGSLLVMKTQILEQIDQLELNTERWQAHLKVWDLYLVPHLQKKSNPNLSIHQIEIEALNTILSQRMGLDFSILISMSAPKQQKEILKILEAYSSASSMILTIEDLFSELIQTKSTDINFKTSDLNFTKTQTTKSQKLIDRMYNLPNIFDLHSQLKRLEAKHHNPSHIDYFSKELIQVYYNYLWGVTAKVFQYCDQIERRLSI